MQILRTYLLLFFKDFIEIFPIKWDFKLFILPWVTAKLYALKFQSYRDSFLFLTSVFSWITLCNLTYYQKCAYLNIMRVK